MMCVAKAITSGYFPLGATLVGEKIAAVLEEAGNAFGSIGHGYTYSGHPVGCAAGLAALAETRRLKLDENAAVRGSELLAGLETLRTRHSLIGDLRGRGMHGGAGTGGRSRQEDPRRQERHEVDLRPRLRSRVIIRVSDRTSSLAAAGDHRGRTRHDRRDPGTALAERDDRTSGPSTPSASRHELRKQRTRTGEVGDERASGPTSMVRVQGAARSATTDHSAGPYLLRDHADRPGVLAGVLPEFEIGNPDFTKEGGCVTALFCHFGAAHHARPRNRRTPGGLRSKQFGP